MEAFRLALVFLLAMGFFYRGETNSQYDDKKMWDFLKTKSNTNNFFREILNEMVGDSIVGFRSRQKMIVGLFMKATS